MGKVGGSLKLKTPKTATVNKTGKSVVKSTSATQSNTSSGDTPVPVVKVKTQKTPAQLAFEAAQLKKQQEKLPILAAKSHKEKVAEFNEYLGKLSEHHDIPKVGPG